VNSITDLQNRALAEISASADLRQLDDLRVRYLGKKGEITGQLKSLGSMEPEQRKSYGQQVNVVRDAVNQAIQERERAINEAWAEYNQEIPRARGLAEQKIEAAEGYAVDRVNRAKGDAQRFIALEAEYRKAPEVTRARIYLETLAEVLPNAGKKLIFDEKAKGILPMFPLGTIQEVKP